MVAFSRQNWIMKNKMITLLYIVAATQASAIITKTKEDENAESKEATSNNYEITSKLISSINIGNLELGNSNEDAKTYPVMMSTINNKQLEEANAEEHTPHPKKPTEFNIYKEDLSIIAKDLSLEISIDQPINKKDKNDNPNTVGVSEIKIKDVAKLDTNKDISEQTEGKDVAVKDAAAKPTPTTDGAKELSFTALRQFLSMSAQGELSPLFF